MVILLRLNIDIKPFTDKLSWPLRRFYRNHFNTAKRFQLTFNPDFSDDATDNN